MRLRSSAVWLLGVATAGAALAVGCLGAAFTDGAGGGASSSASATGATGTGGVAGPSSSHASSASSSSTGTGPACDPAKMQCGTACVDVRVDADNCGACARKCENTQVCAVGFCVCRPGFASCASDGGTICVDLQHDPKHCGSCNISCDADNVCVPGAGATTPPTCVTSLVGCPGGSTLCNGGCYENFDNAQLDCGSCGSPCTNLEACGGGKCEDAYVATCATCTQQKLECCQSSNISINFCMPLNDACPGG